MSDPQASDHAAGLATLPEAIAPADVPKPAAHRTPKPLPIRMLSDRLLIEPEIDSAERRSVEGLVIPATAVGPKRVAWAQVVAQGQQVRHVQLGNRILFDPEDRAEVDIAGTNYVLLRERDIHAVAEGAASTESTGLYL